MRCFILDDLLKKLRIRIQNWRKDPNNLAVIRSKLNEASRDIILGEEIILYFQESLEVFKMPQAERDDATQRRLIGLLNMDQMHTVSPYHLITRGWHCVICYGAPMIESSHSCG